MKKKTKSYVASPMTGEQFRAWLKAMGWKGADAARHLGVRPGTVTEYKRRGGAAMLALACKALFHRQQEAKDPWE